MNKGEKAIFWSFQCTYEPDADVRRQQHKKNEDINSIAILTLMLGDTFSPLFTIIIKYIHTHMFSHIHERNEYVKKI